MKASGARVGRVLRRTMEDSSSFQSSSDGPKRRKMGRPVQLTDEERKANLRAKRDREKAKRRGVAAKKKKERMHLAQTNSAKKKEERMHLAQTNAVKYFSSTAKGAIKEGFAIAALRTAQPTQNYGPLGYSLHANQMATIQQQQQQQQMAHAQLTMAAQVQAQFMVQASAAASVMAHDATGGVARAASHFMLPLLLAGMPHGGMTIQNIRGDFCGDCSSGKEGAPPIDPTTTGGTAASCKRKYGDNEEQNDTPFADDEDASAGVDANANDNAEGHSRPNILLLGMSYPDTSILFGGNADPSPRDVAEAVENGRMTQIDARDLVRARALEKFADVHAYW